MNEHDDLQHPDESINNIAAFVVEVSRVLKRLDLNTYWRSPRMSSPSSKGWRSSSGRN
jgi:hypothetical protein